jgi:hypothetical protein
MKKAYLELRHRLATMYGSRTDAERFGIDSNIDMTIVDLSGYPLTFWSNLLEAARKQRKLSTLFSCIATDNSELSNLLTEVEQDLKKAPNSFASPIDLTSIQFDETEERELADSLANALNRLSKKVVDFALSVSPPNVKEADAILLGNSTAEAKSAALRYRFPVSLEKFLTVSRSTYFPSTGLSHLCIPLTS